MFDKSLFQEEVEPLSKHCGFLRLPASASSSYKNIDIFLCPSSLELKIFRTIFTLNFGKLFTNKRGL